MIYYLIKALVESKARKHYIKRYGKQPKEINVYLLLMIIILSTIFFMFVDPFNWNYY